MLTTHANSPANSPDLLYRPPPTPDSGDRVLAEFTRHLANLGLPADTRQPLLLAVSGGGDSMGMAVLFCHWQQGLADHKPPLFALVIDHAIRPESAEESRHAQTQLQDLGIATTIARINDKPPTSGVQAWARQHRYRLLTSHARGLGAILVTAHHLGDQIETVEMRLMRHSGLRGLAGMRADSWRDGVRLIRPCLGLSRQSLAEMAQRAGLAIAHDPSNEDMSFLRPRLRAEKPRRTQTIGSNTGVSDSQLLRLARAAHRITHTLDARVAGLYTLSAWGYGLIRRVALDNAAVFCHSAALVASAMRGSAYLPNQASFVRLHQHLTSNNPSATTLAGCEWRFDKRMPHHIIVMREAEVTPPVITITASPPSPNFESASVIFDRRWLIHLPATSPGRRVEYMGSRRFASLRRRFPHGFANMPVRAFWSLPVVIDTRRQSHYNVHSVQHDHHPNPTGRQAAVIQSPVSAHDSGLVLDDGGYLPYICQGSPVVSRRAHAYSARFLGTPHATRSVL